MARMSVSAAGPGTSPGKVMFYLGMLFVVIGATVSIKARGGVAALVPGSVCDMRIEREDDLMNPYFDPLGVRSSVSVSRPNCSANITVPLSMSRFCPYCDIKVSVDGIGCVRS